MDNNFNFTPEFNRVINSAKELASLHNDTWVYLEHIVLAIFEEYCSDGITPFSVESKDLFYEIGGLKLADVSKELKKLLAKKKPSPGTTIDPNLRLFDPEVSKILSELEGKPIGSQEFMSGVLETDTEVCKVLTSSFGINKSTLVKSGGDFNPDEYMNQLMEKLSELSGGSIKMKRLDQGSNGGMFGMSFGFNDDDERTEEDRLTQDKELDQDIPFLSKYGRNMVDLAKSGKYDPMIGREPELQELIEILSCRKKNNAILLGDPGTGKTSIIEGLSQRIAAGNVPGPLRDKRIFSLDLNSLVAGTKYRGQYEERLQGVIKDVTKHPDIIVYIDEFHNLVGNGSSSGSGDGANILKPYLARGEFQCIGATTSSEYKKFVEKDGALKRRFQNIRVYQPSEDETVEILENIKEKYEKFHGVVYSTEIVRSCVNLSSRYITDRFFPDKAIDILDMAGARAKLDSSNDERVKELEHKLARLGALKVGAVKNQEFLEADKIRKQEKALEQELKDEKDVSGKKVEVTPEIVSKVIEKITGVPASKISQSDMGRLRDMKGVLEKIVIGQPEAIKDTVMSLQRNALGLRDPKRPIASLMMIGPTGSGKTYICKTIAKEFFGTDDALIRFDMSEFSEKHEITKLLGSTASYVGYDDEPLFEKVRNRPHCVVLFDEIEKAAPEIYQVFLNILDEGSVTLGNGVKVNFQNSIIIFTGNIGTKELGIGKAGFGGATQTQSDIEAITKKALKKTFSPEFINRLSKVIVFNKLTDSGLKEICKLEVEKLAARMATQGYTLEVSEDTVDKVVTECDKTYGARDLQRNIVKYIEEPVCDELLVTESLGKTIKVSRDNVVVE